MTAWAFLTAFTDISVQRSAGCTIGYLGWNYDIEGLPSGYLKRVHVAAYLVAKLELR